MSHCCPSAWYYPGKDPEPLSRKMSQAELVWNAAHGGETILSPTSHETYRRATQLTKHQDDQLKAVLKVLDAAIITRPVRTNANLETAGCPCNISAIASSHLRLKDVDGERKSWYSFRNTEGFLPVFSLPGYCLAVIWRLYWVHFDWKAEKNERWGNKTHFHYSFWRLLGGLNSLVCSLTWLAGKESLRVFRFIPIQ